MTNSIYVINAYRCGSVWAFDDAARGLLGEPFVGDANSVIDALGGAGRDSVTLLFSDREFPGHHVRVDKISGDSSGTYYQYNGTEFWLCPALFRFFTDGAPENIFVKVEKG